MVAPKVSGRAPLRAVALIQKKTRRCAADDVALKKDALKAHVFQQPGWNATLESIFRNLRCWKRAIRPRVPLPADTWSGEQQGRAQLCGLRNPVGIKRTGCRQWNLLAMGLANHSNWIFHEEKALYLAQKEPGLGWIKYVEVCFAEML